MVDNPGLPKFFADTSNISEIERLVSLGIISGITTNPVIVAKEASNAEPITYYEKLAKKFPNLPISIQLFDNTIKTLLKQARVFSSISPNIVVKVPMFGDGRGLTLISKLTQENITINVTALMSAQQLLLALVAGKMAPTKGPAYVSLFFNRIKDGGGDPQKEIYDSRTLIEKRGSGSQIIVGSIRKPEDVCEAVLAGAHIVTTPPKILWEMISHPKSLEFIEQSQTSWNELLKLQRANNDEVRGYRLRSRQKGRALPQTTSKSK